jgi:hypothetical protein
MAEGGTEPKSIDGQSPLARGQLEINECLGNWLTYLQVGIPLVPISSTAAEKVNRLSYRTDTERPMYSWY